MRLGEERGREDQQEGEQGGEEEQEGGHPAPLHHMSLQSSTVQSSGFHPETAVDVTVLRMGCKTNERLLFFGLE